MSGSLTIRQGRLVLPDRVVTGDLVIEDGVIAEIGPSVDRVAGEVIDGTGLTVLPGVIDTHVSFRDPGENGTEDLASGSRAAAAGGVTAFLDSPKNLPPCTSVAQLENKLALAADRSVVHYGFFIGATSDNLDELKAAERAMGIKVYLGNTSGEMLLTDRGQLEQLFAEANRVIAVHAEDEERLRARLEQYADAITPHDHARVRDVECAMNATRLAVELAQKHGARMHLLHLSCAEQVALLASLNDQRITAEVSLPQLFLDAETAYDELGTLAIVNPPVRAKRHATALWQGLVDGAVSLISSDHAPHSLADKQRPYPTTPAGLPGVEWTLPLLLDQVAQGNCTLRQVANWTSEAPARCYQIPRKGRLETGYDGDVVLVDTHEARTIDHESTRSACGWSPWTGRTLTGWPVLTAVLGRPVFRDGAIDDRVRGRALTTSR